jgi:hypothetical protein
VIRIEITICRSRLRRIRVAPAKIDRRVLCNGDGSGVEFNWRIGRRIENEGSTTVAHCHDGLKRMWM